jgi:hypothetical protein
MVAEDEVIALAVSPVTGGHVVLELSVVNGIVIHVDEPVLQTVRTCA